jgi:hypothetical protein
MMKSFALLCLLFSFAASAQEQNELHAPDKETVSDSLPAPTVWINFGGAFSNTVRHNDDDYGVRSALTGGLEVSIPLSQLFSIQTGLDYIQKGSSFDAFNGQPSGKIEINYFELPVMAKFNLMTGASYFSFFAGPYVAIAVARTLAFDDGSSSDASRIVKQWDTGFRVGAAYAIPLNNFLTASLNLQNDFGIVDINSNSVVRDDAVRNTNFLVTAALGIRL